jgi:hypothetical protein
VKLFNNKILEIANAGYRDAYIHWFWFCNLFKIECLSVCFKKPFKFEYIVYYNDGIWNILHIGFIHIIWVKWDDN